MKHHQHQGASGPPRSLDLVDAAGATARLGISRASLYSYVSRGLVRSFASPRGPRERLYALDDVEALIRRRTRLRRPLVAAATALDWGCRCWRRASRGSRTDASTTGTGMRSR